MVCVADGGYHPHVTYDGREMACPALTGSSHTRRLKVHTCEINGSGVYAKKTFKLEGYSYCFIADSESYVYLC